MRYGVRVVTPGEPRKKRRVFLWIFLVVQVLFIAWIITGLASSPGGPSVASQTAHVCAHHGWWPLFKSHADCMKHYAVALNDATNTGTGLAVAFIVVLWVVVDFLLATGYGVYRLARR